MYFQALDDKNECVGVYQDGELHFDKIPKDLNRTWRRGSVVGDTIDYAWLQCNGLSLREACPPELVEEYDRIFRKLGAFYKSFKIAKIDFTQHCVFDLIPQDALIEFCDIKNKITQHVFETHSRPPNYNFLRATHDLLHDIKQQRLNVDSTDCRSMFTSTNNRLGLKKIINAPPILTTTCLERSQGACLQCRHRFPS